MTPFDRRPDHDIDRPIDQDDLIAFHLHELSPRRESALNHTLQANPALALESAAIAATLLAFPKNEPSLPIDAALLERNWQALRPSLPIHFPTTISPRSFFPRWVPAWAVPTLAASAIIVTALVLTLYHHPQTSTLATIEAPASTIAPPAPSAIYAAPLSSHAPRNASTDQPSTINYASNISIPKNNYAVSTIAALTQQPNSDTPSTPFSISTQPSPSTPTRAATIAVTGPPPATDPPSISAASTLKRQPPIKIRHPHTTEFTAAMFADLTPDRSSAAPSGTGASAVNASYTQTTSPAVGALASFHQQLRPWLGYRVTTTHSEPSFEYDYVTPSSNEGNVINQHVYEVSGTYVVQGPSRRRISTFADAGAGLLAFRPANVVLAAEPVSNTNRATGVIGVSAEFAVTKHWAFHTGYRALLYKSPAAYPTYGATVARGPGDITLSSNAIIGITYRLSPTGTF
jgi:hypothetical protein